MGVCIEVRDLPVLEFIPSLTYNNFVSTGNVLLARFEINLCYNDKYKISRNLSQSQESLVLVGGCPCVLCCSWYPAMHLGRYTAERPPADGGAGMAALPLQSTQAYFRSLSAQLMAVSARLHGEALRALWWWVGLPGIKIVSKFFSFVMFLWYAS